jgi:chromate reductase, NAD(P)H dehydrogenase (quinone)
MTTYYPIKVLGISGSLRRYSYNTALLRTAAELAPPEMTLEIFVLSHLPMFNQDSEKPFPDAVVELRTKLAPAD